MKRLLIAVCGSLLVFSACKQKTAAGAHVPEGERTGNGLSMIKTAARTGDLLVRLGDDLLSYQIKYLNETEQLYSHAGVVVERQGEKLVAHIAPDETGKDGVQYTALDSFLNPVKNLSCALYRYNFTAAERDSFAANIERYKTAGVRFDRVYDLDTEDEMYCSEMISKAVKKATAGRIQFRTVLIPEKMQPALYRYFHEKLSRETIAQRRIMTIDNLYRVPACRLVMLVTLKTLPGD